jgi:hypothetical protein
MSLQVCFKNQSSNWRELFCAIEQKLLTLLLIIIVVSLIKILFATFHCIVRSGLHHHLLQKRQYAKQSTLPVYCGEPFQKLMTTSMQIRRNVD